MQATVRPRPAILRALGKSDPPQTVVVDGYTYRRIDILKHDSWAATARYHGPACDLVCKFNRIQPIFGLSMRWAGHWLAAREAAFLSRLHGVAGIPAACGPVKVDGRIMRHAVAHVYIEGHPLSKHDAVDDDFFPQLLETLVAMHRRNVAYVDLHKRENVIVGDDGRPYLVDFQVCFGPRFSRISNLFGARRILRALRRLDMCHFSKHVKRLRGDQWAEFNGSIDDRRPWWLDVHRFIAVPLRQIRRGLLVALKVRLRRRGAASEAFAEDVYRRERAIATTNSDVGELNAV